MEATYRDTEEGRARELGGSSGKADGARGEAAPAAPAITPDSVLSNGAH